MSSAADRWAAKRAGLFPGAWFAADFSRNEYRLGPSTYSSLLAIPRVTFSRSSIAYGYEYGGGLRLFSVDRPRITDRGFLLEGSATNLCLYARDMTNAAWAATTATVARDQVGVDGAANSACSITATSANATVLQTFALSSAARTYSFYVKRITGSGAIEVTQDNGTAWTAVTVTSAWTRVSLRTTVLNPVIGIRVVTNGDAIAVDFNQYETTATPSSPIDTTSASVTRSTDSFNIAVDQQSPHVSILLEFTRTIDTGVAVTIANFSDGTSNNRHLFQLSTGDVPETLVTTGGSAVVSITLSGSVAVNEEACMAHSAMTDLTRSAVNGTLGTTDTVCAMPTGLNQLSLSTNAQVRKWAVWAYDFGGTRPVATLSYFHRMPA